MLPYAANDMLNVMRHEMEPEVNRQHGAQIARDITHDNDRDDANGPDQGLRTRVRLFFLQAAYATTHGF
jgi:hypothetical protein